MGKISKGNLGMITPEYLNRVILGVENIVADLNESLIKKIAERISTAFYQGEDRIIIPASIADMEKIAQSGWSLEEIKQMIMHELPNIQFEINEAFLESAAEIDKYVYDFTKLLIDENNIDAKMPQFTYEGIPRSAKDLNMTRNEIIKLENAYRRTNGTVKNICQSSASEAYQDYIKGCDNAYMKVQAGMAPDRAISESIKELAEKGITCVQYDSGHKDTIETAISRAVRTGVNQANSEIILQRGASLGITHVKVSQHLGARVTKVDDFTNHSWWQGKIYSLDWKSGILQDFDYSEVERKFSFFDKIKEKLSKAKKTYPDFEKTCGYGQIEGIIGINCRHTFMLWTPSLSDREEPQIDQDENERVYKLQQKQRAMERAMRKTRRELEALKSIQPQDENTKDEISVLKKKLREQGEAYKAFCDKNNLQPQYARTH